MTKKEFSGIVNQLKVLREKGIKIENKKDQLKKRVNAMIEEEITVAFNKLMASGAFYKKCKHDQLYAWQKDSNGYYYDRTGCYGCHSRYMNNIRGVWMNDEEEKIYSDAIKPIYAKYKIPDRL